MDELMREQLDAGVRLRCVSAWTEDDVVADRVGIGVDRACSRACRCVRMDPHRPEVVSEPILHERANGIRQRHPAGGSSICGDRLGGPSRWLAVGGRIGPDLPVRDRDRRPAPGGSWHVSGEVAATRAASISAASEARPSRSSPRREGAGRAASSDGDGRDFDPGSSIDSTRVMAACGLDDRRPDSWTPPAAVADVRRPLATPILPPERAGHLG